MQTTYKHLLLSFIIVTCTVWAFGKSLTLWLAEAYEISQACDNNRTACEMQGVDL